MTSVIELRETIIFSNHEQQAANHLYIVTIASFIFMIIPFVQKECVKGQGYAMISGGLYGEVTVP